MTTVVVRLVVLLGFGNNAIGDARLAMKQAPGDAKFCDGVVRLVITITGDHSK